MLALSAVTVECAFTAAPRLNMGGTRDGLTITTAFRNSRLQVASANKPYLFDLEQTNTLRDALAKVITSSPDVVQFAKDRKYEEAWIIERSAARPSIEECRKYLGREPFKVLIVEYVWNSAVDAKRFVLSLFQDERVAMRDPGEFVKTCLDLFYSRFDFSTFMTALDTKVIGRPYLLRYPAESASIGIFNHWFSVGPVDLWKAGEQISERGTRERITARPEVEKTNLNYQALLFKFNESGKYDGPYYGFKTPCCKRTEGLWLVDVPTTIRWMKVMSSARGAPQH
jgi:hypothetical protein